MLLEIPIRNARARDDAPGVALIRHDLDVGIAFAHALQAELLTVAAHTERLLVEPGFTVRTAEAGVPARADIRLREQRLRDGHRLTSAPVKTRPGQRVALIDSGDNGSSGDSLVVSDAGISSAADEPDLNGHGSAVAEIIRSGRPNADITPINIIEHGNRGPSHYFFAALIYALWGDQHFDVINASLATGAVTPCPSTVGRTVAYINTMRIAQGVAPDTLIVAAGGNAPSTKHLTYPAVLPGALAVGSVEWDGLTSCDYNVADLYTHTPVLTAPGGTSLDPIGDATTSAGDTWEVWGTSFAAAFVTAANLAR